MTDNVEYGPEIAVDGMPDWLGEDEEVIGRWREDNWFSGGPTWKHCYASPEAITAIRLPADHWAYKAIDAGFIPWGGGDAAPEGVTDVLFRGGGPCATSGTGLRWTHIGWEGDIIGYRRKAATDDAFCSTEHAPEPAPAFKAGDYVVALESHDAVDEGETRVITDIELFERCRSSLRYRPATPAEIEQYLAERALVAKYEGEPLPATVPTVELPVMTEEEVRKGFLAVFDADGFATAEDDCVTYLRTLGLIKPAPTPLEAFETAHGGLDNNQRDIVEAFISWQETQA